MSDEIRNCKHCGKPFTVMKNGGGKKFCSKACQVEHNKAGAAERWRKVYKEKARQKRLEAEKAEANKPESLSEVQKKAQAAGMSYGKYMLALQMGRIGG
ncbi:MAG: hypothetical protein IJ420_06140 [Lachnospiraceae bacterium]|nr:hypothetical protein [Lachnospiraceae bacterium]